MCLSCKNAYQINCVIGAHFDVVVFFNVSALEAKLAGLSVEVDVLDGDGQGCAYAVTTRKSKKK